MGLELLESVARLPEEVTALAVRAGNPFASREWMQTWWRHFGADREPVVGVLRDGAGSVQVIVPIYVWRRQPLRMARFVGHGPADYLGTVHVPADREVAAGALADTLAAADCQALLAERLPGGSPLPKGWTGYPLLQESSPVLALEAGSWDEFLASRSSNFRQQVRRRERNLARRHELRFRLTEDPDRLDEDFATLGRLHTARWGKDAPNAFARANQPFHRDFAARAFERGWLRLWTMELDGRPVACWHGLRFAGVEWYYQAGRDPAFDSQAVGFVLLAHTVREAMADGMTAYNFLRGDEAYKNRFGPAPERVRTCIAGRGLRGRTAAIAAAAASRLPEGLRRRALE